ncbi:hypothetical protein IVB30_36195 [Bradyrhizobium sp. 200]|nr:hypothetical protein IVB30_36195 [Bradyrhizobium sp. 200]
MRQFLVVSRRGVKLEPTIARQRNRACGSGLQAIISAAEHIASGHSQMALAGGGENFSRAPYMVTGAR